MSTRYGIHEEDIKIVLEKAREEGAKNELKEWINSWDEFSMREFYEFIEDNRKRLKELD